MYLFWILLLAGKGTFYQNFFTTVDNSQCFKHNYITTTRKSYIIVFFTYLVFSPKLFACLNTASCVKYGERLAQDLLRVE